MENIFFDLDGTLTDPSEGITNSVVYALKKFGITETYREKLYEFIGPPLIDSFMGYYGFSKEKAVTAVEYYREYFSVNGIFENRLYNGIDSLLKTLCESGKKLYLATSKPQEFAEQILHHFCLSQYFCFVGGATMDEKRSQKDEVIAYILKECNINPKNAVMVGDRKYDVLGAHKLGLKAVGVTFGFGTKEELYNASADIIVSTVNELENTLSYKM